MLNKKKSQRHGNKLSMKGYLGKNKNRMCNNNVSNTLRDDKSKPILSMGSTGETVEHLQQILVDLTSIYKTLPKLKVDGVFGDLTKSTVMMFQELSGLKQTGVVDNITWDRLHAIHSQKDSLEKTAEMLESVHNRNDETEYLDESNNVISEGSKGRYVTELQKYINQLANQFISIPHIEIDGVFGPKTKAAVLEIQKLFKLDQDGIVGDVTWNVIYNAYIGKLLPE